MQTRNATISSCRPFVMITLPSHSIFFKGHQTGTGKNCPKPVASLIGRWLGSEKLLSYLGVPNQLYTAVTRYYPHMAASSSTSRWAHSRLVGEKKLWFIFIFNYFKLWSTVGFVNEGFSGKKDKITGTGTLALLLLTRFSEKPRYRRSILVLKQFVTLKCLNIL